MPDPAENELIALVKDRNVRCFQCGYNLRNLTGCICPECGTRITVDLLLSPPTRVAEFSWLLAFIGVALNLRASAELWADSLAQARVHLIAFHDSAWGLLLSYVEFAYGLGLLPGAVVLVFFRHRFLCLPRAIRYPALILIWILGLPYLFPPRLY